MKCNQSRPGFELVFPCPFPTTITITPRASPWLYNIPDAHANSLGHISSNLLLICCMQTRLLPTCHSRNARGQAPFQHVTHAINVDIRFQFTLGTRCISCYFCLQCPTFAAALAWGKIYIWNSQTRSFKIPSKYRHFCLHCSENLAYLFNISPSLQNLLISTVSRSSYNIDSKSVKYGPVPNPPHSVI